MWVRLNDENRSNINFSLVSAIVAPFYYPGMGGVLYIYSKRFDGGFKCLKYKSILAAKKDCAQLIKTLKI